MAARWIAGTVLLALAAVIIAGNIVTGIRARRAGRSFSSIVFLGAGLGTVGVLLLPIRHRALALAAVLLLDLTVPMGLFALARYAASRWHDR
jgi:hypothetical protein